MDSKMTLSGLSKEVLQKNKTTKFWYFDLSLIPNSKQGRDALR